MKVNIREKKILLSAIGLAFVLLTYYYIIEPAVESQQRITAELAASVSTAQQNQLRVSRKFRLEQRLEQMGLEFEQLEAGLLPGSKAPLAAAELQKIVKAIVRKYPGVNIVSEKVLEPVETGVYQRIAVQVTVNCLLTKLKDIIYQIEHNKTLLNISEVNIRLANQRHPKDVKATMVVEGAIRLGENDV